MERIWHVEVGGGYRLVVEIRQVDPSSLYVGGQVPEAGTHLDVAGHIARFPKDGSVLTTGGNNTYVLDRAIVLGPGYISVNSLAHETGHLLGFRDGYFRSFADLGADGYGILEVILNPRDVLTVPENGVVRKEHFLELLSERIH